MKPLHSRTRALQRRAAGVRPMIHPSHRTHSTSLCFSSRRIPGNLLRNSQGLRSTQRYQTSSPNQLNLFNQHQKEPTERLPQGSRLSWVTRVSDWPMVRCQTHGLSKKNVEERLLFCACRMLFCVALSNFFRPISEGRDGLTYSSYSCMPDLLSSNRIWLDGSDKYRCSTRILYFCPAMFRPLSRIFKSVRNSNDYPL